MRVFFVRQNVDFAVPQLSYGLGIIATIVKQAGHQVKVIDNNSLYRHYSNREMIKSISQFQPDVVAFNITMTNALETYDLIKIVKSSFQQVLLLAGGIHMVYQSTEALNHGFDVVVNRDGEKVILPLLDHFSNSGKENFKEGLQGIPGISFQIDQDRVYQSNDFPVIEKLDETPFVDFDIFNMEDFLKTGSEPNVIYFSGSRGCPFKCSFCSTDIQRNDKRVNSAEWMFNYLKYLYERFDIQYMGFGDNNFLISRKRVVEFCNLMIESNLSSKIGFSCQTKVETALDEDVLLLLKRAGCRVINLGIERCDPYSAKMINKISSRGLIIDALTKINKSGLRASMAFLMGFPFDTPTLLEKEEELFQELLEYSDDYLSAGFLLPMPGTVYYDQYPKANEWYLKRNFIEMSKTYYFSVLALHDFNYNSEFNFFNLPKETYNAACDTYRKYKLKKHDGVIRNKNFLTAFLLKLDVLLAIFSRKLFEVSPSIERLVFNKLRGIRYYFATIFIQGKL